MADQLRFLGKAIVRPFLLAVFAAAALMPRDPRRWVFGSWKGQRFADNTKWLFLHLLKTPDPDVRPIWITRSGAVLRELRARNAEAYHVFSPRGMWHCLRAGVYVFDSYANDINYWTSAGAIKVNLWHGAPLKRIERDIDQADHVYYRGFHGNALERFAFWIWGPWVKDEFSMVPASSEHVAGLFHSAFGLSKSRVPILGFPRNDALLGSLCEPNQPTYDWIMGLRKSGVRVVAYLPTFRDGQAPIPMDWARMDALLRARKAHLVVKFHSHSRAPPPNLQGLGSITFLPASEDLYQTLAEVDVLVTDYSSIAIDFMITRRPIVYFAYDLKAYATEMRGFYVPFESTIAGAVATDAQSLLSALDQALVSPKDYQAEHQKAYDENVARFHESLTPAAPRVIRAIKDLVKGG